MAKKNSLWHHRFFLLLWGGQTISQLGSQVTLWALPLTAVFVLNATPFQMGLLLAAGTLPDLLAGLFAGVWVDRVRRRPLLIAADIGRALLLVSIPLAAWLGLLTMMQLYLVAFLTGVLSAIFDVAYRSFLPSLIARDQLIEGNSKLEASASLAALVGPGLSGVLVQLFSGPMAIFGDAFSFIVSALSLMLIRVQELHISKSQVEERVQVWREIKEGASTVFRHPILRTLAICSGLFNFFDSFLYSVYVLFLTRIIGASPLLVGITFVLGGVGGLLGALLAQRITGKLGLGSALLGGVLVASLAELMISGAGGPLPLAFLLVAGGEALLEAGVALYRINGVSLRQTIVPDRLQGRVNATIRVVSSCAIPLGSILGGLLGNLYGLRLIVLIAGFGTLLAFLWMLFSPVRHLRSFPNTIDGSAEE